MSLTRRTRDELAADIAALEGALEEAHARQREAEARAAALAEEKAEAEGTAKLAERAAADFEQRIAEEREALEAAEAFEDACRTLDAAIERRTAAGRRLAVAADDLLARFDELARARAAVEAAVDGLRRDFGKTAEIPPVPSEPPELTDVWNAFRERLQSELDRSLDEELLEAAASSRFPRSIDKLPPHLQEAGRRRWYERQRQSRD